MTKEQAINKIEKTPHVYLNDDQKKVAIGIINSIPNGQDVLGYFDFIMKRADVGFKFDVAPEIATGRIAVVNEMKEYNINIDPKIVGIDENKLIIGDNYEALKNLLLTHKEKIDVIYIDPPYNTEKSKEDGNTSSKEGNSSKFIYKDKFGRNGWLNMMRDRLVLAKRLLSPEGVIFVSIDDSEQAYLKVLMDDIFGEENTDVLIWRKIIEGSSTGGTMKITNQYRKDHEYLVVGYKNKSNFRTNKYLELPNYENSYENVDGDPRGEWMSASISMAGNEHSSKFYSVKSPNGHVTTRVWRVTEDEMKELISDNRIYFGPSGKNVPRRKIFISEQKETTPKSIFENLGTTFDANDYLETIVQNRKFTTTKPVELICRILETASTKKSTVLDFFAGSGTTAHAVMELNNVDKGNRKFILVTNNENNIGLDITYERIYRVINGKTTENSKDFKWLEKNTPFANEKLRVFNIKHFDVETSQSNELENITNMAIENLKKLSPLYEDNNLLQVYYDLDGLNPINEAQKEQIYSTDSIKHKISKFVKDSNKRYCACGKSFIKHDELEKHINKENM